MSRDAAARACLMTLLLLVICSARMTSPCGTAGIVQSQNQTTKPLPKKATGAAKGARKTAPSPSDPSEAIGRKIPAVFVSGAAEQVFVVFDDPACEGLFRFVRKEEKWQVEKDDPGPPCVPRKFKVVGHVKAGTALPGGGAAAGPGGLDLAIDVDMEVPGPAQRKRK